jgi:tetratricopeptide (TPR) repeat protein
MNARKIVVLLLALAVAGGSIGCSRDPNVRKQKYLESGKRYAGKGKYQEAVIQFSNALRVDPRFVPAHLELAHAYLHLSSWTSAYQELRRTVELQPDNVAARLDLGSLLLGGRQLDKAEEQADAVLAKDSNNAEAHALLANILASKENFEAAVREIQRAIALDPKRSAFFEDLAVFQMRGSAGPAGAEVSLQHAIELAPKQAHARLTLGRLYLSQSRWSEAEKQFRDAVAAEPKATAARMALASVFIARKQNDKAEQVLRDASRELADSPEGMRLLANYYAATGQTDEALAETKRLMEAHGKDSGLKKAYVRLLLEANRDREAETVVGQILEANSKDIEATMLRGVVLERQGKTLEAVSLLQQAVKDRPDNAYARFHLGLANAAKGDFDEAEKQWREAVRLEPGMIAAQKALADVAARKGDVGLLAETAENTIKVDPNYADAYIWRAVVESNRHQPDLVEADLNKAISLAPASPMGYEALGRWHLAQKKYADAAKLFEQALERNPARGEALRGLVLAYLAQNERDKALARVQAQVQKQPKNSSFYVLLASLQADFKELAAAETSAQKAVDLDNRNLQAVTLFTRIEIARGAIDKAVNAWQQWVKDRPSNAIGYVVLGSLEQARQNRPQAQKWYETALKLQPDHPVAANNLAYLMLETGQNTDVALTLAQTARRGMPTSPASADTLAWAYYHKGTYGMARDLLQDAVKADENNATIRLHLGLVYLKLSDRNDAAIQLKKVLSLAPNSPTAEEARKALAEIG